MMNTLNVDIEPISLRTLKKVEKIVQKLENFLF